MCSSRIGELDLTNARMVLDAWATRKIPTDPPNSVNNINRPIKRSAVINGRVAAVMSVALTGVDEKLMKEASRFNHRPELALGRASGLETSVLGRLDSECVTTCATSGVVVSSKGLGTPAKVITTNPALAARTTTPIEADTSGCLRSVTRPISQPINISPVT